MKHETFPRYADRCGWNALLPKRQARPAAQGSSDADYVIVGAGYTGLAAARRLHALEPHASIVVLEATEVGEGSSARNSGFASPHESALGVSDAQLPHVNTLIACLNEGFSELTTAMEQNGFGCDLERSGRMTAAATEIGTKKLTAMAARGTALNVPHRLLDQTQLRDHIGTDYYQCGLFIDEGYLLQPAALIRGLADHLPPSVALYENAPVVSIERDEGWRVTTDAASIHAKKVILATNAAVKKFGFWRDRLVTIFTYAGLTEEMDPRDSAHLGERVWGVLPAHRLGTTMRRVGANRFLVRSLYSYERPINHDEVVADLTACFHRRYPMLSHVRLEYVWGGTTALTMNGAPRWGEIEDGLFAAAGCNGSGIVKGTLLGKRLADMMVTGDPQEDLSLVYGQANWVAPEPFRTLGFHVVSAFERRKAGLER
jgi:glycine/D-amino acid oxidase-like deaminating enzyme